jgi:dephospho-CoA kinase
MKRILITGMSGTGKSTAIAELAARGHRAFDMDYEGRSMFADDGEWIWNEKAVTELLADDVGDALFICGAASNQGRFYPQFDEVILLSAPKDVIIERLLARSNNPFGKQLEERAKVLADLDEFEPRLRRRATHEIVTTAPVAEVVARILKIAGVAD